MNVRRAALLAVLCLLTGCARPSSLPGEAGADRYPRLSGVDLSAARAFDPWAGEVGTIRYTLSAPALVRIRIVDGDTPGIVLRTLLDWEPRAAGTHSEPWDGRDHHGVPVNPRRVSVHIRAEPRREADAAPQEGVAAVDEAGLAHSLHPADRCHDLQVRLEAPGADATVSGVVEVRAALAGPPGLAEGEYHVMVYLNGRDAWDGRVPGPGFVQSFDTRNVPNGEYLLAVTYNDLHDHAGS
ncbi:MAG: hypothetical protein QME94_19345, partial [Anaerolineae bacterium]|nr:hypothetical protein [Anaerolineae bacterium]